MIIKAARPEEARIHDTYAGYHRFHADQTQEPYGSFEIFWRDLHDDTDEETDEPWPAGWYWRAGFPGCLPDGGLFGPFATSHQALENADEWNPEFDD
jgi:hypothetical protein